MTLYLMVAIGGALGAVGRYSATKWINAHVSGVFPWATLSINIVGSIVMGLLFVLVNERMPSLEAYRPLLMVGFLGAFTTFSTFSLEIVSLLHQQAWLSALSYLSLSCFLGVSGAALGILLGRLI